MPDGYSATGDNDYFRVDLDDPQGFAYAYGLWVQSFDKPSIMRLLDVGDDDGLYIPVLFRHLVRKTTEADKIWLAKALAEVMS